MTKQQITYHQAAVTIRRYCEWRNDRNPNGKGVQMPPPRQTDKAFILAIEVLEALAYDEHLDTPEANKLKVIKELFKEAEGMALEKLATLSEQFKDL